MASQLAACSAFRDGARWASLTLSSPDDDGDDDDDGIGESNEAPQRRAGPGR